MIYAIFSGEYSDWNVHGYFTDLEIAEKYCTFMNNKGAGDYYIVNLEEKKVDFDIESVQPEYKWVFNEDFTDAYGDNGQLKQQDDVEKVSEYGHSERMIVVITKTKDREKAVKIAQDYFAKWKYEQVVNGKVVE